MPSFCRILTFLYLTWVHCVSAARLLPPPSPAKTTRQLILPSPPTPTRPTQPRPSPVIIQNISAPIRTGLSHINQLRAMHGAPDVIFDADMSSFAKRWADYLVGTDQFMHSSSLYGENLALMNWAGNATHSIENAIRLWYNEFRLYNYSQPRFSEVTGHFTALVWKSTTRVGLAVAPLGRRAVVMACFYPPGNVAGEFTSNVLPLMG